MRIQYMHQLQDVHVDELPHLESKEMSDTTMITRLGEIAAKAANRAIKNGDRAGADQNRAQFVEMVKGGLKDIPGELLGDEARAFLEVYADGAYGAAATAGLPKR
jgi:hypothetical protein